MVPIVRDDFHGNIGTLEDAKQLLTQLVAFTKVWTVSVDSLFCSSSRRQSPCIVRGDSWSPFFSVHDAFRLKDEDSRKKTYRDVTFGDVPSCHSILHSFAVRQLLRVPGSFSNCWWFTLKLPALGALQGATNTNEVATVMGSIPASSDTVESEGRQMKQI